MAQDHGDPRPVALDQVLRWADLRAGDVVFNGITPEFVVLECDLARNVFRWFSPLEGTTGAPDFTKTEMWHETLETYSHVLRGDKELRCFRYSTLG